MNNGSVMGARRRVRRMNCPFAVKSILLLYITGRTVTTSGEENPTPKPSHWWRKVNCLRSGLDEKGVRKVRMGRILKSEVQVCKRMEDNIASRVGEIWVMMLRDSCFVRRSFKVAHTVRTSAPALCVQTWTFHESSLGDTFWPVPCPVKVVTYPHPTHSCTPAHQDRNIHALTQKVHITHILRSVYGVEEEQRLKQPANITKP